MPEFKYLGSMFTSDGSLDAEVERRVQLARAAFNKLSKTVWRPRSIPLANKLTIYHAMVRMVLLYGAHSWALTVAQMERLEQLQRDQLRNILGPARWSVPPGAPGGPQLVSNERLLELCGTTTIGAQLHTIRHNWLGHLLRMGDERLAKQLLFATLVGDAPDRPDSYQPNPSLISQYATDLSRIPRSFLRKYKNNLFAAAEDKPAWKGLFSKDVDSNQHIPVSSPPCGLVQAH